MEMRRALQEISSSPFSRNPDANLELVHDMYHYSPEEDIIRQRSRTLRQSLSTDEDNDENNADFLKTPRKDPAFIQLNRKRLLLTPPDEPLDPDVKFQPEPAKKPKLLLNERHRFSSTPLISELRAYSTQQLVDVVDRLLVEHPHLEREIRSQLPQPDLKLFYEKLQYLRKNVYRSLPSCRLSTGRDALAYKRAKIHQQAFKRELTEQGRTLLFSQSWSSVIKYVLKAWKFVSQLPVWENPSHNVLKQQCCRMLAAHCMVALKRGTFNGPFLREVQEEFVRAQQMNKEIEPCSKYLKKILGT